MSTALARQLDRPASVTGGAAIAVNRWPTEIPLTVVAGIAASLIWLVLIVSIAGILYVGMFGLMIFFAHVAFVAHIRGNGVRLGPEQFPELYERLCELSRRMGMKKVPETYLIQAGGSLNALATRFLRTHMLVLFTDLLDECGDDIAARDMIIGHELGHVHAGHLRSHWFLLPAWAVPFLGPALSRAREFTCDRYGLASAGDRDGALLGLTILAAGGAHGREVNREALVRQRADLNTGWMTLAEWFATHPPMPKRLAALEPSLGAGQRLSRSGPVRALAIIGAAVFAVVVGVGSVIALATLAASRTPEAAAGVATGAQSGPATDHVAPPPEEARAQLREAVATVSAFLTAETAAGRGLPDDLDDLAARWQAAYPDQPLPTDPFDGLILGYTPNEDGYTLWSSGPDASPGTEDDLVFPFGE